MKNNCSIVYKNAAIFYRVYGSGRPVVLLHGFGADGNTWNNISQTLQEKYLVIVPDLPGSGASVIWQNEKAEVTIDNYAEVIIQILKNENIDQCTIIGHSMGGYITLAIAEKKPEMLNAFGLFNSTAFADSDEKKKDRVKTMEFIKKNGAVVYLNTSIPGLFAEAFRQQHKEIVDTYIHSLDYFSSDALIQYANAMMNRPGRINIFNKINVPVLFIIGEEDTAVPLQKALEQCYLPKISHVNIFADMGHMGMIEKEEQCTNAVLSFLENVGTH